MRRIIGFGLLLALIAQFSDAFFIDLFIGPTNEELKIEDVDPNKTTVGQLKQVIEKKTNYNEKIST